MNKLEEKIVTLKELPKELDILMANSTKSAIVFSGGMIEVNRLRTKSNVAEIDGFLYYFGNTLGNVNPYKQIKRESDLLDFIKQVSTVIDKVASRVICDIVYVDVSKLLSDDATAERLLTSHEITYPDYVVSLPKKTSIEIKIDHVNKIIATNEKLEVNRVGHFDLKKLFNMEFLNSLFIVKMAHARSLDMKGVMNLLYQLNGHKSVKIVMLYNTSEFLTIALHVLEKDIPEIFGYKSKKRLTEVSVDDLTGLLIQSIKR